MRFIIEKSKIKNRVYEDILTIYSSDNDNTIVLPNNSKYQILAKNIKGALPVDDRLDGNEYNISSAIYCYYGELTLEFIDINNKRETVLIVNVVNKVSIANLQNKNIKNYYVKEIEDIIRETIVKIKEIEKTVDNMFDDISKINFEIVDNDLYVEKSNGGKKYGNTKFR